MVIGAFGPNGQEVPMMEEFDRGDIALIRHEQGDHTVRVRARVTEILQDGTLELTEIGGMGERYRLRPYDPPELVMHGEKRQTTDEWIDLELIDFEKESLDKQLITVPERHEDDLVQLDVARGNAIVGQLYGDGYDTDWITSYDVIKARDLRDGDQPYTRYDKTGTIAFPNEATAAIWQLEILGQISDGAWENYWVDELTPGFRDDWQDYFELEVVVDESIDSPELRDGGEFPVALDFKSELLDFDAMVGRMLFYARYVGDEDFSMYDLKKFISDLMHLA